TGLPDGTYQVVEQQPTALVDGGSNTISGVTVSNDLASLDHNFAELGLRPQHASIGWYFASSARDGSAFREQIADSEQSIGNSDLAAAIRAGDGTFVTDPPTSQVDFTISESVASGTLVGQLTADSTLTAPVTFQIEDATLDERLELRPVDHLEGDAAAPVVMIEYLDFQCPHCKDAHAVIQQLEALFPDELVVVRRYFPIFSYANEAAYAAEAAAKQGKYAEMVDVLFDNQTAWSAAADAAAAEALFEQYATDLGLDLTQYQADVASQAIIDRVAEDAADIAALGGTSTPTFFINGVETANFATVGEFASVVADAFDAAAAPLAVDRSTGQLIVANAALLDAATTPQIDLTIVMIDTNGSRRTQDISVAVTA
ncbi:MAG: thioredoxin domain-containing protein, partial [Planctomycetales bacterium]|nr:thioredoxin domain-containing protein [Planctomycetales bacterium]